MSAPVVTACALDVHRGGSPVLHGLSFDLEPGVATGVLGPSGSGKTTLIRTIVGLQSITAGSVEVLGEPAGSAGLRSRIGYSPQGMSVYRDLTVVENVRYFAACLSVPADDVDRVIAQVDLDGFAQRLVGSLSGGQQSRVSLAIALLGSPELLVLDEPTVGLDPVLREQLWELFAGLVESGVSLIVSSHVMDEADRCGELLLLRDGVVLTVSTPSALKQQTGAATMDEAFLRLVTDSDDSGPFGGPSGAGP